MKNGTKQQWSNLSKDERAIELAKTALGWDSMTTEQQIQRSRELIQKAQEYKGSL